MTSCHSDHSFDDLAWDALVAAIYKHFGQQNAPLFRTEPTADLWSTFLKNLSPSVRQQHNCRACAKFFKDFGALVTINDRGEVKSAVWPAEATMKADKLLAPYVKAVAKLRDHVQWGEVTSAFYSPLSKLGQPVTGEWTHLYMTNSRPYVMRNETADQRMAREKGQFAMLVRVADEYPLALCQRALVLMQTGGLYRASEHMAPLQSLIALHQHRERFSNAKQRKNLLWVAAVTGNVALSHLRGTALGALLDGLAEGKSNEEVKRAWNAMLDPSTYQRATEAPKEGTLAQAEKLFATMGLEPALRRRYASVEEIPLSGLLWSSASAAALRKQAARATKGGVFAHLKSRGVETDTLPAVASGSAPVTMTWEKFKKVVLPTVHSVSALIPTDSAHFAALVTAADSSAPPLMKWDEEPMRNPFSWYYHGGIDAEMKARVERAGGQYEHVDIRATLMWNNRNDLDLHVQDPSRAHIYYADKMPRGASGGYLDVDMNVRGETTAPVENTRWAKGAAPSGMYKIWVRNYAFHEADRAATPFVLELQVGEHTFRYEGRTPYARTQEASDIHVATFNVTRDNGRLVFRGFSSGEMLRSTTAHAPISSSGHAHTWGLAPNTWVEVTGIATSPNTWGNKRPEAGDHTFFLLRGAADGSKGRGRGFFAEMLKGELRPVRSVMEAYAATAAIEEAIGTPAAGLGFIADRSWNLRLRVTTDAGSQDYLIDRKD